MPNLSTACHRVFMGVSECKLSRWVLYNWAPQKMPSGHNSVNSVWRGSYLLHWHSPHFQKVSHHPSPSMPKLLIQTWHRSKKTWSNLRKFSVLNEKLMGITERNQWVNGGPWIIQESHRLLSNISITLITYTLPCKELQLVLKDSVNK